MKKNDRIYVAALVASGGIVLALEVLSSRILTPYFGVSLYIWAGILSITLLCLALGYDWGGRLTRRHSGPVLRLAFALFPALAGAAVSVSALVYPLLFVPLAQWNLILGSFLASLAILLVPLLLLSALNPMLVAIVKEGAGKGEGNGDGGAGRVFFLSTLGSVAGVLVTAFLVIPNLGNFEAMALFAAALGGVSFGLGLDSSLPRRTLALGLGAAVAAAGIALAIWDPYGRQAREGVTDSGWTYQVTAARPSLFGTVKVVEGTAKADKDLYFRLLFHDGISQNEIDRSGQSLSEYTHAIERLTLAAQPGARSALVLGLGAGIIPGRFAQRGLAVDAVEINPEMIRIAESHFGFDPSKVRVTLGDARTEVRRCRGARPEGYDILVMDLFFGDATPDYLLTRQFFADAAKCLTPGGTLAINAFSSRKQRTLDPLLATLATAFPHILLVQGESDLTNSYLLARAGKPLDLRAVDLAGVPLTIRESLRAKLARARIVPPGQLASGQAISDEKNRYAALYADAHLALRRFFLGQFPPELFVN